MGKTSRFTYRLTHWLPSVQALDFALETLVEYGVGFEIRQKGRKGETKKFAVFIEDPYKEK
jgi:hypothetical protein